MENYQETFLQIAQENIHRYGIDQLLDFIAKSDFFSAPASTKFHGSYPGGLVEHSVNVYRAMTKLNADYNLGYSEETIAITALFHDICKINFYKIENRNVKNDQGQWVTVQAYGVDEKIPLGHGEKSCIMLQWYIQLNIDELLAIRWHMGEFDTAVKGGDSACARAQDYCKLVPLLHIADMIATKIMESK